MPSSDSAPKHSRLAVILAPLILIIITLAVCELLLRAWFNLFPPLNYSLLPPEKAALHMFLPSAQGGFYASKPDYRQKFLNHEFSIDVQTNNIGLREERDYDGQPVDIAFIGDSFTFGWGVQAGQRYSDGVRESFPGLEVFSYSYPNGHAPIYYLSYLQNHPELMPRVLVLGLFAFNDLASDTEDALVVRDPQTGRIHSVGSKTLKVNRQGFIVTRDDTTPAFPSLAWLARHTAIGRTVKVVGQRIKAPAGAQEKPDTIKPLDLGQFDETALTALGHIVEINELAESMGSSLVVLYIPFASEVNDYPICQYSEAACKEIREKERLPLALELWAEQENIHFINPLARFKRIEAEGQPLYYNLDGHWNRQGHGAAASLVTEYLSSQGLLETH